MYYKTDISGTCRLSQKRALGWSDLFFKKMLFIFKFCVVTCTACTGKDKKEIIYYYYYYY